MTEHRQAAALALRLQHVSKTFDGVRVLRDVGLELERGEVHALLGENGSGKSTLVKILAGYHDPDPDGVIEIGGQKLDLPLPPGRAGELGLAFVHQNLGLVRELSVLDNLRVKRYATRHCWRIDWKAERAQAHRLLARFGVEPPLGSPVADVSSMADRAMIAIARALDTAGDADAGVLILDEPTVYLPETEVRRLLDAVRSLCEQGTSVIYVTHRITELPGFADRVTVLRDGALVGTVRTEAVSSADLIQMIVGPHATTAGAAPRSAPPSTSDVVLSARSLSGYRVADVSLEIRAGEIVGMTGLPGMGSENVPKLLVGATKKTGGEVSVGGQALSRLTPRTAIRAGAVLVPGDRAQHALAVDETVTANLTLPNLSDYFGARLDRRAERRAAHQLVADYDIRPPSPSMPARTFSGGNQQKAVLAKWLQMKPRVVLVEEPTQGIDVAARAAVHRRLQAIAEDGAGVLVASSEYEELADLCDRVLVMRDGVISECLTRPLSRDAIAHACYST